MNNLRNELTIFKRATEIAIEKGYLVDTTVVNGVDILLEPPSLFVSRQPLHASDDHSVYLDMYTPILDREWGLAFWGRQMERGRAHEYMPAWMFHQHKCLDFLQTGELSDVYNYIELFIDE